MSSSLSTWLWDLLEHSLPKGVQWSQVWSLGCQWPIPYGPKWVDRPQGNIAPPPPGARCCNYQLVEILILGLSSFCQFFYFPNRESWDGLRKPFHCWSAADDSTLPLFRDWPFVPPSGSSFSLTSSHPSILAPPGYWPEVEQSCVDCLLAARRYQKPSPQEISHRGGEFTKGCCVLKSQAVTDTSLFQRPWSRTRKWLQELRTWK